MTGNPGASQDPPAEPGTFDQGVPNAARIYDRLLSSCIAQSHVTADHLNPAAAKAARAAYDGASARGVPRTRDDIEQFLDGLDLVPPGVTDVTAWRPAPGPGQPRLRAAAPPVFYDGAARIPPR